MLQFVPTVGSSNVTQEQESCVTVHILLLQIFLEIGKEYILNEKYSSVGNLS